MRLEEEWNAAALDLGLDITIPFLLELRSGKVISARVLLKRFGAIHGMLIVSDERDVIAAHDEITLEGYGFSVLDDSGDEYSRDDIIDVLREWGWAGDENAKPAWL